MAVEWGLTKQIFSIKTFFFALTPVFSVEFFYNIHSSWVQFVENVVNTRSCIKKINTVIYRETGII